MYQSKLKNTCKNSPLIGVGLRHQHFANVLADTSDIDFVEVHSENFFAQGGASLNVLEQVRDKLDVSLHSTAMGLGSAQGVPVKYLNKLNNLAKNINPILMSDHACFTWSKLNGKQVHAGDLLPLMFNKQSLMVLAHNIDKVQQFIGRPLLIENLSAYFQPSNKEMPETEFLTRLTEMSGCNLLIDLNNILVTGHNLNEANPLRYALNWLKDIPKNSVGEIHLAGYTPVEADELVIDDHSQPVSKETWHLYGAAIKRFGNIPTLIEWDNNLPNWSELVNEAKKARSISTAVLGLGEEVNLYE